MTLPNKVYLTRGDVIRALGSRRKLRQAEGARHLARVMLPGYKIAHYRRADLARYLAEVGAIPLDRAAH